MSTIPGFLLTRHWRDDQGVEPAFWAHSPLGPLRLVFPNQQAVCFALLSNYRGNGIDPPSSDWLGHFSNREKVRQSGLWNSNHVDEDYEPSFLEALDRLVGASKPAG